MLLLKLMRQIPWACTGTNVFQSPAYTAIATPTWCSLLRHAIPLARSWAVRSVGSNKAASSAMMAITTKSSTSVKARLAGQQV